MFVDIETVPPEGITTGADTVAVLEKAAEPAPPALDAVTRQRIGLIRPIEKKLDGGEYVEFVAPDMFKNVAPWSLYCHW